MNNNTLEFTNEQLAVWAKNGGYMQSKTVQGLAATLLAERKASEAKDGEIFHLRTYLETISTIKEVLDGPMSREEIALKVSVMAEHALRPAGWFADK